MNSLHERHDKLIRATDLDALSCRYNMNIKLYLNPSDEYIEDLMKSYSAYLQFCTGYTSLSSSRSLKSLFQDRKLPIINRGTYLRTRAISDVVDEFVKEFKSCQIISLGSGSDTRAFTILEKLPHVIYHEIDFDETAKIKKLAIMKNSKLRTLLGVQDEVAPEIHSKESFAAYDPDLHYNNYHLHGIDLREVNPGTVLKGFNAELPTIVLSECVLCYLSPEEYSSTIKYWTNLGDNLTGILIYEPMSLRDLFGETMNQNLQGRGLNLQTFDKYPDLESRLEFLKSECKLTKLRMTSLSDIGGYSKKKRTGESWISAKDLQRINALEFVDEIEEIRLLLEHYCLCYGEFRSLEKAPSFEGVDRWSWQIQDQ